ncbi:transglycosylase SLT domain protein [Burkholderia sp. WAC0059]|uniref:transglycosylase SLT domain-containing protein n=1 Tax=Burkholderia sp. WAC0059 TaxID=2066022 RepID=UPI000C7F6DE4|nr:transglycosylase SLT domain-containing protein [Burkholderia sp. WAC0059]PLZ01246.1 transglycosylase SLT domain protein [Burkholderia sp. WAC0059]
MNTWLSWLSWRADDRLAQGLRALLRRGTRLSHNLFSIVGGVAVLFALAVWLMPTWRGTLAARMMPFVTAAVEAGPARLLEGNPLPSFAPQGADEQDGPIAQATGGNLPMAATADAGTNPTVLNAVALNGLDPRTLPNVSDLARMIPSQNIVPDARDDRVLVSAREQALVASYLSRRYRVAEEPVAELVKAAFDTGHQVGLDPLLLLAVMAIESGFNPYAESGVGAQGLMQVMSKVHSDKFQYFGGQSAALDPLANIKVGALVLKDCIARGGSLPGGLRLYVGSTSQDDGGYGAKVMAERARLRAVARGVNVPVNAPQAPAAPVVKASDKRVRASLDGAHPLTEKTAAAMPVKATEQDDASVNARKSRVQGPELGA